MNLGDNMIIETLKKEDLKTYKELMDVCFDGSNELEYYVNNYKEDANYKIFVAKDDNKIVGSITIYKLDLFTFSFQPALEIFNVAVLPKYRGQKIAKKLFEVVIDYAKQNNYKSIHLTCLDTAYNAHKLYESVGFKRASSVKYNFYLN
jgi:ribosomal protein S18 acetylase RimI-like enzyme